ncbi:MAG TPA: HAD family hydrolase [Verrucomicrobiae bacterium]|nr:HAD family hydrolase [Verrucomicrobiae bacterium]
MRRAVFLDRDGTLIAEKHYLHRIAEVEIFPGAIPALRRLHDAGFLLFVITNQSGVGRGYFTLNDVENVSRHIASLCAEEGVCFARVYVAPEHPDAPSRGRKPSPQFAFDAREEFGLDLSRSYMIGDKLIDLECGWNAGLRRSLLVRTGYGAELERTSPGQLTKAVVVDGLPDAADWILKDSSQ